MAPTSLCPTTASDPTCKLRRWRTASTCCSQGTDNEVRRRPGTASPGSRHRCPPRAGGQDQEHPPRSRAGRLRDRRKRLRDDAENGRIPGPVMAGGRRPDTALSGHSCEEGGERVSGIEPAYPSLGTGSRGFVLIRQRARAGHKLAWTPASPPCRRMCEGTRSDALGSGGLGRRHRSLGRSLGDRAGAAPSTRTAGTW